MHRPDSKTDRNGKAAKRSSPAPTALENLQDLNFSHLLYFWTVARDGSIASACERLQVSQPTISMQIRKLEKMLGHRLFDRSGRGLVLTEMGRTVFEYAEEMFSLGREMLGTLRGVPGRKSGCLHVGIPNFLPKLITFRLLDPLLHMPDPVQLSCREAELHELTAGLAKHKFDVILTDAPVHSASGARVFNHPLGECDIAICGVPALAARYRPRFPESLDGAPFLLPETVSDMRRTLDYWFDSQHFTPRCVAEVHDSALMKEFGGGGSGLFPMPSAVVKEVMRQYDVELVGRLHELRVRYFAVTTERKLTHPATVLIAETAKAGLLSAPARA